MKVVLSKVTVVMMKTAFFWGVMLNSLAKV